MHFKDLSIIDLSKNKIKDLSISNSTLIYLYKKRDCTLILVLMYDKKY